MEIIVSNLFLIKFNKRAKIFFLINIKEYYESFTALWYVAYLTAWSCFNPLTVNILILEHILN